MFGKIIIVKNNMEWALFRFYFLAWDYIFVRKTLLDICMDGS